MANNYNQFQQEANRKTWMTRMKNPVFNMRNSLKKGSGLEEAEVDSILGKNSPTVLLDKVQTNPSNANIRVDVTGYDYTGDKDGKPWHFPGAYGTALIAADGKGSLRTKTPVIVLPYRQEAPLGQRQESKDQREARYAMNDFVAGVFSEEGLLDSAQAVQARVIIPAIHHHEDGTTSPCVYILSDTIITGFRGRLETSRQDLMPGGEELPSVEEQNMEQEMDDEMAAALMS